MGPIWSPKDPGGPHVAPMNFAIRDPLLQASLYNCWYATFKSQHIYYIPLNIFTFAVHMFVLVAYFVKVSSVALGQSYEWLQQCDWSNFEVIYTLCISRYNITRYCTQLQFQNFGYSTGLERDTDTLSLRSSYGCISWVICNKTTAIYRKRTRT